MIDLRNRLRLWPKFICREPAALFSWIDLSSIDVVRQMYARNKIDILAYGNIAVDTLFYVTIMYCLVLLFIVYRTIYCCVDVLERSGTPFRNLLFIRNSRSGTYCQISRNNFYLPFRHLFTVGGYDDYKFMTPCCLKYLQPIAYSCTPVALIIDWHHWYLGQTNVSKSTIASRLLGLLLAYLNNLPCRAYHRERSYAWVY